MTTSSEHSNAGKANLSQLELEEIAGCFRLFDTDNEGFILLKDVREVAGTLAGEARGSEHPTLDRLLNRCSTLPDDAKFNLDEFVELVTAPDVSDTRDEIQKVFDLFDTDKKGYITASDLRRVSDDLSESLTNEELDEMIARTAAAKSGKVSVDEFEAMMMKRLFS